MARSGGRLSQKQVENARPAGGRRAMLLSDGGCLYLQSTLGAGGRVRRSWVFRYERGGVRHDMGLGPFPDCGLAEARDRARRLRQQLRDDIDPLEERRIRRIKQKVDAAKAVTFRDCAEQYVAAHRADWRNSKHAGQWTTTLATYAYPVLGDLPVADVDLPLILRVLEPHWRTKRETMSRLRGRLQAVLDWASVRGYRSGDNPAAWRGRLEHVLAAPDKAKGRHAALPWCDVPEFMAELRERDGAAARALEFTILTAARSGEVLGARWDEIDLGAAVWAVPASRTKANREHRVPISERAVALLEGLPRASGARRVFAVSSNAMLRTVGGMRPGATTHGFRSAFRDWAGERTNFAREIAEAALAHVVGDETERAYRRGDALEKRRGLMEQWAAFCAEPAAGDNVMPLRRGGGHG